MSELSDYKRICEAPMIAGYEATIKSLRTQVEELRMALESASIQAGNVIYNARQREFSNAGHLASWDGIKRSIDAALSNTRGGE